MSFNPDDTAANLSLLTKDAAVDDNIDADDNDVEFWRRDNTDSKHRDSRVCSENIVVVTMMKQLSSLEIFFAVYTPLFSICENKRLRALNITDEW